MRNTYLRWISDPPTHTHTCTYMHIIKNQSKGEDAVQRDDGPHPDTRFQEQTLEEMSFSRFWTFFVIQMSGSHRLSPAFFPAVDIEPRVLQKLGMGFHSPSDGQIILFLSF